MRRIAELDGLRGVAIVAVLAYHALKVKLMWAGVDLFFVLSGFLITGILLQARSAPMGDYFARFYGRRARRILPPYLLTLGLAGLLVGWGWTRHWYLYLGLTNFLMPLGIRGPDALAPLWSLAVEEQFYLLWPFAVYLVPERRLGWLAGALMVAAPVLRGTTHFGSYWVVYEMTPFRMDLLAAGALLCLLSRRVSLAGRRTAWAGGLVAALGLAGLMLLRGMGVATFANTRTGNVLVYESTLLVVAGLTVWALSGWYTGILRWAPLRFMGTVSYTFYLVHMLCLGLRHALWLELAVCMAWSTLSWYLLEKPLLGWKRAPKMTPGEALAMGEA